MAFTKEELEKIRVALPASAKRELADRFKIKPGSLRNILSGRSNNDEVVIAAFTLAEQHKQQVEAVKSKLRKA